LALGVSIEHFSGLATFTIWWMLDIFLVPFIIGVAVARMFGNGSQWLACLPPVLVRGLSYLHLYYSDSKGDFFLELYLFYWAHVSSWPLSQPTSVRCWERCP
jgi:hypothetical protein